MVYFEAKMHQIRFLSSAPVCVVNATVYTERRCSLNALNSCCSAPIDQLCSNRVALWTEFLSDLHYCSCDDRSTVDRFVSKTGVVTCIALKLSASFFSESNTSRKKMHWENWRSLGSNLNQFASFFAPL